VTALVGQFQLCYCFSGWGCPPLRSPLWSVVCPKQVWCSPVIGFYFGPECWRLFSLAEGSGAGCAVDEYNSLGVAAARIGCWAPMERGAMLSHRTLAGSPFRGPPSRLWGNPPRIHLLPPPSQYIRDSPVDNMAPSEAHGLPLPYTPSPFPSDRATKIAGLTEGRSGNRFCFLLSLIAKARAEGLVRRGNGSSAPC
jgi:hypothetical protein